MFALFFLDQGNASAHLSDRLYRGPGAGVMISTVIGDIELTVAKAWDLPDRPLRVQFNINRLLRGRGT